MYTTLKDLLSTSAVKLMDAAKISTMQVEVVTGVGTPKSGTPLELASIRMVHAVEEAFPYAWYDSGSRKAMPGSALVFKVTNTVNNNPHFVILSAHRDAPSDALEFTIHCGDNFLEGATSAGSRKISYVSEAGRRASTDPIGAMLLNEAAALYGKMPDGTGCSFWSKIKKGEYCGHVSAVVAALQAAPDSVVNHLQSVMATRAGGASLAARVSGKTAGLKSAIEFTLESLAFKTPILLEGDRGSGKTHAARGYAKAQAVELIELGGHESVEAWELFGQYVQNSDGKLVWKDGKLSRAFRLAASKKVVLLIDEMLRIPQRHLSALLTCLSPFEGQYQLSTGRIVNEDGGVGEEEVLRCPKGNLAVMATTNVGPEFAVDELDPAVAERFVILRKDSTEETLLSVLKGMLADKGFSEKIADRMVEFFRATREFVNQGLLNKAPTIRTLTRAVELSEKEEHIRDAIRLQALLWVERDSTGHPVAEQLNLVDKALAKF